MRGEGAGGADGVVEMVEEAVVGVLVVAMAALLFVVSWVAVGEEEGAVGEEDVFCQRVRDVEDVSLSLVASETALSSEDSEVIRRRKELWFCWCRFAE